MYIKHIDLVHFRNYEKLSIDFNPNVNIIIGDNAQGKTNLVESIYILGFGKSFRTTNDQELIKMDEDYTRVRGLVERKHSPVQIDFTYNIKLKKEIKVNEIPLKKLGELMGHFNVVIFSPEDLQLVKGTPAVRRRYIDKSIAQIFPNYYHLLVEYNRILKQRNNLLKKYLIKGKDSLIDIFDEQLCRVGSKIMVYRMDFLEKLRITSNRVHFEISHKNEDLSINYVSTYLPKNLEDLKVYDKIYSEMLSHLQSKIDHDIKRGYTSIGPHRDDLSFLINNIEGRKFGSQGQVRTLALSLKLSEITIIKESLDESPILILDDVLSELDQSRQNQLVKFIADIQTFITTTEINNILSENIEDAKIIQINNGTIGDI